MLAWCDPGLPFATSSSLARRWPSLCAYATFCVMSEFTSHSYDAVISLEVRSHQTLGIVYLMLCCCAQKEARTPAQDSALADPLIVHSYMEEDGAFCGSLA